MKTVKTSVKFLKVTFWILAYLLHSALITWWIQNKAQQQKRQTEIISLYSRRILRAMNYRWEFLGTPPARGSLIISNHLSYIDILVMSSISPSVFVTSIETRDTPFLGLICRLGGCIFVERRRHFVTRTELREVTDCLSRGLNVVLFPEATTTDGTEILPFKRAFMKSAQMAGRDIYPLCINYFSDDQPEERSRVCYFGDMNFATHLLKLLQSEPLTASLRALRELDLQPSSDLRPLAKRARAKISSHFARMNPMSASA